MLRDWRVCLLSLWLWLDAPCLDGKLSRETLEMGLTTVKFKEDIINLFTSKKYATRAALDIGAGTGFTTAALAVNFAVVVAIEKYWDLANEFDCYHLESNRLLRKDGSEITNIVRLHMDTLLPFAFANLVDQNFSAVVIDAQHDFESIARETFHVLRDIPCCVETIVYHDYCFEDVFQTILWFELSGLLTFQKFMGEPSNSPNCKSVGENLERAEGVAMKVNRRPLKEFHEKVEEAFRGAFTLGGSLEKRLNGTQWLLLSPHSSIGILTIHSRPRLSHLSVLRRPQLAFKRFPATPDRPGGTKLFFLTYPDWDISHRPSLVLYSLQKGQPWALLG
ncbi:unnamed protein product, partial [Symbiodinium microadriaticum]